MTGQSETTTKTEFVTRIKGLYTDLREVGGSLLLDGENRTRAGDTDKEGLKPSVQLAWDLWDRFDSETRDSLVDRIDFYIRTARLCIEAQQNPMTRDPRAKCRPVITIDEFGSPTCDVER
ncbi:MAG: hypothetical protein JO040_14515 [Gemmatimonadetes bacterium]|nr:hypothetical protein [Gemmatimonadota bacterium]